MGPALPCFILKTFLHSKTQKNKTKIEQLVRKLIHLLLVVFVLPLDVSKVPKVLQEVALVGVIGLPVVVSVVISVLIIEGPTLDDFKISRP